MSENSWSKHISVTELLRLVNQIAADFEPATASSGKLAPRAKQLFSERSFRHYQTNKCIDAPAKEGRNAVYGYRHFIQALVVRKLLHDKVPSSQIQRMTTKRSTEELQRILFQDIGDLGFARQGSSGSAVNAARAKERETWQRIAIAAGLELHMRADFAPLNKNSLQFILAEVEKAIRPHKESIA